MDVRAARAYRTIFHESAAVLAGQPPMELLADAYQSMYRWARRLREQGTVVIDARAKLQAMRHTRRLMIVRWSAA